MDNNKKNNNDLKRKRISAILKLSLLGFILIAIPLYIYFFQHDLISYISNIKKMQAWLQDYQGQGMLIYIGAQIVQIIICIIPGQALQFAAGYLWGFLPGLVLSIIGAILGTVAVYYISRLLGHDALHLLFGQKKITEAIDHLNSKNGLILTFFIFLLPGIPKDLFTYAAGLSDLKLKPFLILSVIARTPGMIGSLIIGNQVWTGGYTSAIIIAIIAVLLFIVGMIFRKSLFSFANRVCDKLLHM